MRMWLVDVRRCRRTEQRPVMRAEVTSVPTAVSLTKSRHVDVRPSNEKGPLPLWTAWLSCKQSGDGLSMFSIRTVPLVQSLVDVVNS